jgi:hypothetical protein
MRSIALTISSLSDRDILIRSLNSIFTGASLTIIDYNYLLDTVALNLNDYYRRDANSPIAFRDIIILIADFAKLIGTNLLMQYYTTTPAHTKSDYSNPNNYYYIIIRQFINDPYIPQLPCVLSHQDQEDTAIHAIRMLTMWYFPQGDAGTDDEDTPPI